MNKKPVDGYTAAWLSYKRQPYYKNAMKALKQKGCPDIYIEELLHHAFNAGWSLLITTFLKDAVELERQRGKKEILTKKISK